MSEVGQNVKTEKTVLKLGLGHTNTTWVKVMIVGRARNNLDETV